MEKSLDNTDMETTLRFIGKIKALNSNVIDRLSSLREDTYLDNVRGIIGGLERYLAEENKELDALGSPEGMGRLMSLERSESRGAYDHLNKQFDIGAKIESDDLGGILDFMLSFCNYKINSFSLWSEEYSKGQLGTVFAGLVNKEEERKRKLENLIDTFVHKDW